MVKRVGVDGVGVKWIGVKGVGVGVKGVAYVMTPTIPAKLLRFFEETSAEINIRELPIWQDLK
jgi:hypothetical protein